MTEQEWHQILSDLASKDLSTCVAAAKRVQAIANMNDVPRLLELLKSSDFFEREAAAWPLSELVGPQVLPQLFEAYQLGFEQGHDNDGFTAALLEIPALHPTETQIALNALIQSSAEPIREHAQWLMDFC